MASDLTNLRARTRSAELHRSAELRRLHRHVPSARASERESVARPTRPSRRRLGSLADGVRTTVARVSATGLALTLIAASSVVGVLAALR